MKKKKSLPPPYAAPTKDTRFAGTYEVLIRIRIASSLTRAAAIRIAGQRRFVDPQPRGRRHDPRDARTATKIRHAVLFLPRVG